MKMKIETMKVYCNNKMNAAEVVQRRDKKDKSFTALKSIEFESLEYPEMKIQELSFCGCDKREHNIDLFMNMRLTLDRKEFFDLIHALKEDLAFWREEDLPCTVKIEVHKKKDMIWWKNKKKDKDMKK